MKKHIYKKFLFEIQDDELATMPMPSMEDASDEIKKLQIDKNMESFVVTDTGECIRGFPFNDNGIMKVIPEPDPVLIYFDSAYNFYKAIADSRKNLLKSVAGQALDHSMINIIYNYFSLTAGYVTFLFTSIEAFINRKIPEDFIYEVPGARSTERYNKDQILRYLSFSDKMNKVLPAVYAKDFKKTYNIKSDRINHLKEYRDSIIHTKPLANGHTPYDYLFKKAFKFAYEETLDAVRDFINFYEEGLIEDCPCNIDR